MSTETAEQSSFPESASSSPERKSKRTPMVLINFWLDVLLLINVVLFMWLSTVLRVVFPPPTYADSWTLWGLGYDQWDNIRFASLCLFTLLALEHLVFHWNWICGILTTRILKLKSRPDEGTQAVYGVGTFIGILLLLFVSLMVAYLSVKEPPSQFAPPSKTSSVPR